MTTKKDIFDQYLDSAPSDDTEDMVAPKECHVCDHLFDIDEHGIAHHRTQDGEVDYDLDAHHVPYALEDL
jgi:hypothetical protein